MFAEKQTKPKQFGLPYIPHFSGRVTSDTVTHHKYKNMRVKINNLRSKGLTLNPTEGSSKRGEFIFP